MPIYEYLCNHCKKEFEIIRSMKQADADLECIYCQSPKVKRQISLFNATSSGRSLTSNSCSGCTSGTCSSCGARP